MIKKNIITFTSTMPADFRDKKKRKHYKTYTHLGGIQWRIKAHRKHSGKLLNCIFSLITGCSTLAWPTWRVSVPQTPTPPVTSTSRPRWQGSSVFNHLATGIIKLEDPSPALHTDAASFVSAQGWCVWESGARRVLKPPWLARSP